MLRLRPTFCRIVQQKYGKCIENVNGKIVRATSTTAERGNQSSVKTNGDNTTADTDAIERSRRPGGIKIAPDSGKLRARIPLVKNFFVGVVDSEMLGYPEVVNREDMTTVQNQRLPLKEFFANDVNNCLIDRTRQVPKEVIDGVRQLGLYGLNVPVDYDGGKGWGWTASLMLTEPETTSVNVALGLLSHRVIVDLLKELGSSDQKAQYLPKLANGSLVGVEAIFEYDPAEIDLFNTTAEYYGDTREWVLNGKKAFCVTGPFATTDATPLYLVIAQSRRPNVKGDAGRGTSIFLVDGSTAGVKLGEQHLTVGCRGLQICSVEFKQVHLPESCVVGAVHEGNQVAEMLLRSSRLRTSILGLGMAKQLVNDMTAYSVEGRQCSVWLKDMEMLQMHLAKASCVTYAMESMIYMTAGILDEFALPDVSLEAAITKYYTLTHLFKISSICMDFIGPKSLLSGQETEVLFRDAAQLYTQNESMDTLRLFIAVCGLQHAGELLAETVRMQRNPLFHPGHMLSKFLQSSNIDNPRTKMRLNENLHPSLEPAAQYIEQSVARLQMSVELMLTRYGSTVVEKHHEMKRIADIASTIYAMFASTARANRSYCIGLQFADYELVLASTVCTDGRDKVYRLCQDIFNGHYVNNDGNLQRISKKVITQKGYFPEHPLTYNY